jgi:hypothetical protein
LPAPAIHICGRFDVIIVFCFVVDTSKVLLYSVLFILVLLFILLYNVYLALIFPFDQTNFADSGAPVKAADEGPVINNYLYVAYGVTFVD